MKIGIIGAGNVGKALAQLWANAGHDLMVSYSRKATTLQDIASSIGHGTRTGTPAEAGAFGEIVVFTPPFEMIEDAASKVGSLAGKIVIDTTNPFKPDRSGPVSLPAGTTSATVVAQHLPGARLVKAFNTLPADVMGAQAHSPSGERLVLYIAGDDPSAKESVAQLVHDAGFDALDAGPLVNAHLTEIPGPLFLQQVTLKEAQALLKLHLQS